YSNLILRGNGEGNLGNQREWACSSCAKYANNWGIRWNWNPKKASERPYAFFFANPLRILHGFKAAQNAPREAVLSERRALLLLHAKGPLLSTGSIPRGCGADGGGRIQRPIRSQAPRKGLRRVVSSWASRETVWYVTQSIAYLPK